MITLLFLVLGALAVGVVLLFNGLVQKRQLVDNGWADIDVQLKRRGDLIPRLVETVKGYAAHERALFKDVIERRNAALSAGGDVTARGAAEGRLQSSESRLLALAEDYPDLKANTIFLELQTELSETEDKIEMARRFYNGAVRGLNTSVETFPGNLVAGMFGFSQRDYFEIYEDEAAAPVVEFDQ